jgi:hypothetical protein
MHKKALDKDTYWFAKKENGLGWYPIHWAGYFVLTFYVIDVFITVQHFATVEPTWQNKLMLSGLLIMYTGVIFVLCILKGKKSHWHWKK